METVEQFMLEDKPEWATAFDLLVFGYLLVVADEHGVATPSNAEMLKACGVSKPLSIRRALRNLEEHGWVKITLRIGIGARNIYTITKETE